MAYLAAWDVHRAKLFGRCEAKNGIEPFGRQVDEVMSAEPYASADRVFWVVDNGSSHRGETSVKRLEGAYSNLRLIHLPVHASWLNQIEIYFSVVQRKVLSPNDFADVGALAEYLLVLSKNVTSRLPSRLPGSSLATILIVSSFASQKTDRPRPHPLQHDRY